MNNNFWWHKFKIFLIYILGSCFHLIIYFINDSLTIIFAYKNTSKMIYVSLIIFLKMLLYSLLYVPFFAFFSLQYVFTPTNSEDFNYMMEWYFWLLICYVSSYFIVNLPYYLSLYTRAR